jgi:hypothetical protein
MYYELATQTVSAWCKRGCPHKREKRGTGARYTLSFKMVSEGTVTRAAPFDSPRLPVNQGRGLSKTPKAASDCPLENTALERYVVESSL